MRILKISTLVIFFSSVLVGISLAAGVGGVPEARAQSLDRVPLVGFPAPDLIALAQEDARREEDGLPYRFAASREVSLTPGNSGTWENLSGGRRLWRLRIGCPEVLSLNLGFTDYRLPSGATLLVYSADKTGSVLHFDADDNRSSGQLWTPVLLTTELVIELEVDAVDGEKVILELGRVGCGYRDFGEDKSTKSGLCNIDVVCPEGDDWRDEIASVGVYSFGGNKKCTGVLVNNTGQDQRPLFLTADHCEVNDLNVASVVVYWNFESSACGDHGGGSLEQWSNGETLLASSGTSDFALVELAESPDPVFGVIYAGWDRSGETPPSAVGIHHPSTDEKSISFEDDALSITTYRQDEEPGNGTHLRVDDWDLGTTEPGSSGSPLFDPQHRIVGQLHGGYAACDNDLPDWYGRLSVSWEGDGSPETRLRDYLDPAGSDVMFLNRFNFVPPPPGEMDLGFVSVVPNPFLGFTEATFRMNQVGQVQVRVLNLLGQLVRDLGSFSGVEGENSILWNGLDKHGRPVAAGLYLFYLESAGQTARGQVVRLR